VPSAADPAAHAAAETVARRSYGKLVAFLAARSGDVAGAEDALSDAFAAALIDWPGHGIPANPEAWLLTTARRKRIDTVRRQHTAATASAPLALLADERQAAEEPSIPDHRLALMFVCAHPAIDRTACTPLMLQTVLGFDAATIASAFLTSPAAMGQRLVRAKTKIRDARIPFRVPEPADLGLRLPAVLDAIYAAFAEGWCDPAGTETRRRALAQEGIWLGRLVASLLPDEPEALGLLALMLYAEARRGARRDAAGDYVPLDAQDPAAWDPALIDEAEMLLGRASRKGSVGRYQLEAAIQSAHVVRRCFGRADWQAVERLYDGLVALTGSPVVAINRAVAIGETRGAMAGLAALDVVAADARVTDYQPYWAARAGLLARIGDAEAARIAYRQAIGREADPAVRRFLQQRCAAVQG
jgi:RNA polymerase sigma-70 factor (ECF subfamily)